MNEIVREQSRPTVQIGLLAFVLAIGIVLANLVVDILHGVLDPRIREARP